MSQAVEDNQVYLKWVARMKELRTHSAAEFSPDKLRHRSARQAQQPFDEKAFGVNGAAKGVSKEYHRMGRRPISPSLEADAQRLGLRFEHLATTIGTVIHGVDLRESLSDAMIGAIRRTLLERKVIFFRNQHISIEQQTAFARRFGFLDAFPFNNHVPGHPHVLPIAGIGESPANAWHTDVTWMQKPSLGSILHMIEVPEVGGDTCFSDSHAAYLGLPELVRKKIEQVYAVHDYRTFCKRERGWGITEETLDELKREVPFGVVHPLIRTHPETGKHALMLNAGFMRQDSLHTAEGPWGAEESKTMVSLLLEQHKHVEYQCRFKWEKDSIAFWDNRACQHCAVGDYYPNVRVGYRVTVAGSRPYYDPNAKAMSVPVQASFPKSRL